MEIVHNSDDNFLPSCVFSVKTSGQMPEVPLFLWQKDRHRAKMEQNAALYDLPDCEPESAVTGSDAQWFIF
ncbi:hypothetical protein Ethha_1479 [Ethanoligenens harbinense YUAN-3]|uniref:Uncharacterized protein n=1 Tax=Ethanoligenens harbinense (strain DSM 18485 / JCM 12961 / CGMCC 1.5033 / YUAN-3) TaxID=663278 RepID=E6U7J3_ETHHY|nr:hypothetical protein Ethha_1479 [Ethanoligenens harbinense YUAN-3]AVQ96103.1 hypothetical protein CXQ68_07605 [Ethanoligenens harbinense YUAN-3]AYF38764.1 hypothetical protein CXP51_07475 [Ethanoligenens harbinense]AYF41512.1 hypothetical protein CN246_07615 [Ethanoligenens harbinense]QCN92344.1 hypothetical protein DRA42_07635 [Ethanoligenens harbinense]